MKEVGDILSSYGHKQQFVDTAGMILSNRIDFGNEIGGLISSKQFPDLIQDIKMMMKIAYKAGKNACDCGLCDYCSEFGMDSFDDFIENFKQFIPPSPTLETPQNSGGNQGEGEGER